MHEIAIRIVLAGTNIIALITSHKRFGCRVVGIDHKRSAKLFEVSTLFHIFFGRVNLFVTHETKDVNCVLFPYLIMNETAFVIFENKHFVRAVLHETSRQPSGEFSLGFWRIVQGAW